MDWDPPAEWTPQTKMHFYYYNYVCTVEEYGVTRIDKIILGDMEQEAYMWLRSKSGAEKPRLHCIWCLAPDYFPV
jgi:hypothetical protein